MYTLYYTTRSYTTESTALIPRIALEEIGVGYEVIEVELEPAPPDWYLAINPHGKIPSLTERRPEWDHEVVIYPSAAILVYLANNHPDSALLPTKKRERGLCYRTMFDMAEMLQNAYMMFFYSNRFSADDKHVSDIRWKAVEWLKRYWERINRGLVDGPYLVGDQYSICDIYLYVLARWYVDVNQRIGDGSLCPFEELERLAESCALIESRPAVKRALAADEIESIARG